MSTLDPIDWNADSHEIGGITIELDSDAEPKHQEVLSSVAHAYGEVTDSNHHVYCLEFVKDGEQCWYVGETANIRQRLLTHIREKDVRNIEVIEELSNKQAALERERTLSYEVAIEKDSTDIFGGR